MTRVLILSAPVGEGHSTVAGALADDLRAADPDAEVTVSDTLAVLGPLLDAILVRGFRRHLGNGTRAYEVAYQACMRLAPAARAGELALLALGGRALARTIAAARADVVVSTYPVITAVLGGLRAAGRLPVPAVATVSDLVGLRFWTHPGIDLHLLMYEGSISEVTRIAGRGRAEVVQPILRAPFRAIPPRVAARYELDLPPDVPVVAVSGGGWGVGDVEAATRAALTLPDVRVLALTGRNAELRAALQDRLADESRARVLGFTDRMPAVLAASDALVHSTAGVTALEALTVGCPLVCFGFPVGHVRANVRALARAGLATEATTPQDLTAALRRILAERGAAPTDASSRNPTATRHGTRLPAAAPLVLDLVRRRA